MYMICKCRNEKCMNVRDMSELCVCICVWVYVCVCVRVYVCVCVCEHDWCSQISRQDLLWWEFLKRVHTPLEYWTWSVCSFSNCFSNLSFIIAKLTYNLKWPSDLLGGNEILNSYLRYTAIF